MTPGTAAALDFTALARVYGTPLLAIDTDALDANVARFERAAQPYGIGITYAAKAFFCIALARRLCASTLSFDVCSLGELVTAERGGVPPDRIVFHGCGKTAAELQAARDGRAGRIVVDHIDELQQLAALEPSEHALGVLLRVNTGIEADTHDFIQTSGARTKFGFVPAELAEALALVSRTPQLHACGLHAHIGSQIFEPGAFVANLQALFSPSVLHALGRTPLLEHILGGGFGVSADGTPLAFEELLAQLSASLDAECARISLPRPHLFVEPGRAIVASAGTSLYRVVTVKDRGERRFVIVDGSLADNPRPALYGASHPARLAARASTASTRTVTICGRSCERDELAIAELPADVRAGDLLAFATTGAYTYSMSSNYNRFTRPAVAFVARDGHRLAIRAQSIDAMLADDTDG